MNNYQLPPMFEDEEEEDVGISANNIEEMEENTSPPEEPLEDWEKDSIDAKEYSKSKEAEEADWWDFAKDVFIQPALGAAKAYTWPLDILKIGVIGEGLTDIDELESEMKKAGKPFDRDEYIKNVMEFGELVPTQQMLEDFAAKKTGISLEPKTKTGKFLNKLFFIRQLARGQGFGASARAGVSAATVTHTAREAGAPEWAAELAGDVGAGIAGAIERSPRQLSGEAARLQRIADRHGLPFLEHMARDNVSRAPKITANRRAALEREMGMSIDEAITRIVEDRYPLSRLRQQGQDLDVLQNEAYDWATDVARQNNQPFDTSQVVADIDAEIARIRGRAPSPSDADRAALRILENERNALENATPDVVQMIQQTRNYNSNVVSIYRKPEFSGVEDEVRQTYAFLNQSIRNSIDNQAGPAVQQAQATANRIFAENSALARTEGLLCRAFRDGHYDPKELNRLLNSRQGAILRRDLGDQGVQELRDIADYGQRAQKATEQFANSPRHSFRMKEWGPLAGFLLAKIPGSVPVLMAAKPMSDYVRGWALTRPAARTVYRNIIRNAANGSFKNMAADFQKLEGMIDKEYGSMEDFMQSGIDQLTIFNPEED